MDNVMKNEVNGAATNGEPLAKGVHVRLVGEDGNAFAILGRVRQALRRGGRGDLVEPFTKEATSGDYTHLLATCLRYCECD